MEVLMRKDFYHASAILTGYFRRMKLAETDFTTLLLHPSKTAADREAQIRKLVFDQRSFDLLFHFVFHHQRALAVRAVEAVEKISRTQPLLLSPHKNQLLSMLATGEHKEWKTQLVPLLPRLALSLSEQEIVWRQLVYWVLSPTEGKLMRIHALQALHTIARIYPIFTRAFKEVAGRIFELPMESLQLRLKSLLQKMPLDADKEVE